jgi:hypothetical protein
MAQAPDVNGLLAEVKFQLAKIWPAFTGETKPEGSQHGQTARDTSICAIGGCSICKVLAEAMISCHATTLQHPVGH